MRVYHIQNVSNRRLVSFSQFNLLKLIDLVLEIGCYISGKLSLDVSKPGLEGIVILGKEVSSVNLVNHSLDPSTD